MGDERTPAAAPWQNVILVATGDGLRDIEVIRAALASGRGPRERVYQAKTDLDPRTYRQLFGAW